MNAPRSRAGLLPGLVAVALVVAACAATTPPPSVHTAAASSAAATPTPGFSSRPTPSGEPHDLGAEIAIGRIDPALAGSALTFASDGESVLFSSGVAEEAGADAAPDLYRFAPEAPNDVTRIWIGPDRTSSIVGVGGDLGTIAWVSTPTTGERAWDLWLRPRDAREPMLLDRHPGDADVSSLVPSFSVYENTIAWTSFDRGPDGPASQLLIASAPDWTPRILEERLADEAELWLPSLYGSQLAYTEVVYAADRSSDERRVYVREIGDPGSEPERVDRSGRATMPLSVDGAVLWKEADPGFNMFNWGRMFRHDLQTGQTTSLGTWPQEYVNYPSAGSRFVAWWGADSFQFGVYDMVRGGPRLIERYSEATQESVVRPHVAGDLLVWLYVDTDAPDGGYSELRWAFLPAEKEVDR